MKEEYCIFPSEHIFEFKTEQTEQKNPFKQSIFLIINKNNMHTVSYVEMVRIRGYGIRSL